jgi:hypothetical protein
VDLQNVDSLSLSLATTRRGIVVAIWFPYGGVDIWIQNAGFGKSVRHRSRQLSPPCLVVTFAHRALWEWSFALVSRPIFCDEPTRLANLASMLLWHPPSSAHDHFLRGECSGVPPTPIIEGASLPKELYMPHNFQKIDKQLLKSKPNPPVLHGVAVK